MHATQYPPREAALFYGAPDSDPDLLYFGEFMAPDPFIAVGHKGKKIAVLSALERGRAEREGLFDEIVPLEVLSSKIRRSRKASLSFANRVAGLMVRLAMDRGIACYHVPPHFPHAIALVLLKRGLKVRIAEQGLCPERLLKSADEARKIAEVNATCAAAMRMVQGMLRRATVRSGRLFLNKRALTSEEVRYRIDVLCLERGCVATNTIVACGDEACDPHARGSGPLYANELLIVDVFPKASASGYHGDMTRTFLKGDASEGQKHLVAAVRAAQKLALRSVRPRVTGHSVHAMVQQYFNDQGYQTETAGVARGFFHSTGHGLGLEVHEAPRVGPEAGPLRAGMVVTIEPGLYYQGLGGCRIEDVVQVTSAGCEMLSKCNYQWHMR